MSKVKLQKKKRDLHVISSAAVDKGVGTAFESKASKSPQKCASRVLLGSSSTANTTPVHKFFDPLAGP
jgi:hypothetical protein